MSTLFSRFTIIYKQKGFFGLVKSFISYPYRHLPLGRLYLNLFGLCDLLRGKCILKLGDLKIQFVVGQLTDATCLHSTYNWERFIWNSILKELKPNDVFWDVGANIGFYTLLASSHPDVKVFAFEPNPITVKLLENNVKINSKSNIEVLNKALSDSEGEAWFDTIKHNSTAGTAHLTNKSKETNAVTKVIVSRGDTLIKSGDVRAPDILKIDTEGAEFLVIKGMGKFLSNCRIIICEVHPSITRYGDSAEDFEAYLGNEGFKIEYRRKIAGYEIYHIIATRT